MTRTTRLKRVVNLRAGGTPTVNEPRFWADAGDGIPWVSIGDMSDGSTVLSTERELTEEGIHEGRFHVGPPGTLLFAMYASVGAVAELGVRATWNQALLGLLPRQGAADRRFVYYWLQHLRPSLAGLVRSNTQDNLNAEQVGNFPFPVVPVEGQRAIADYLDTETARVDALIAKKQRLLELISEREGQGLSRAMDKCGFAFPSSLTVDWSSVEAPAGWKIMRLSMVLNQLTNGYVGPTRDILQADGIPYIQSLHIKRGLIDFARRPFFVSEPWHRERPRIHLMTGDVLIVQTGDIGQVAVVPEGFGEASCHALQIARVRAGVVSGRYLGEYLRTPFGIHSLLSRATGALHPHLEAGILDIPVVVPPLDVQGRLMAEVDRARADVRRIVKPLVEQVSLLHERRRALITAAVTGLLEVPGAAA